MRFRIVIDIRNLSYTVAALTGGLGAFCGAITNVLVYPNLAAAATAHLAPGATARFLVTGFSSRVRPRVHGLLFRQPVRRAGPGAYRSAR